MTGVVNRSSLALNNATASRGKPFAGSTKAIAAARDRNGRGLGSRLQMMHVRIAARAFNVFKQE
jgi:hypothetical protein